MGTSSTEDTIGYLFNANKEQIAENDDGASNRQFLLTQELTAGVTYYWGIKYYTDTKTGSIGVKLTKKADVTNYTVTTSVSPSGAGTVTGGGTYAVDTMVTFTASPASGYRFKEWQYLGGAEIYTENPVTVGVVMNTTMVAVFEEVSGGGSTETKNIEIRCGGSTGGTTEIKRNGVVVHDSGDTYSDTFNYGEEVTLTAKFGGDNLYTFNDWEDDETGRILSTSNPYTFTVGSDTPNKICMGLRLA